MSNRNKAIYFLVFAILYPLYILGFVGHGVDIANSSITIGLFVTAGYFYLRSQKEK